MNTERKKGAIYSGILHVVVFLLGVFGLPLLISHEEIEEPSAITVEILPIAAKSNVRNNPDAADKPEQETPKPPVPTPPKPTPETPKPPPPKPPAQPVKTPDAAAPPPPKPPEQKKPDAPKPPEPEAKKPPPPKPDKSAKEDKKDKAKKTEDPLDAVLKSLKANEPQSDTPETKETAKPAASKSSGKKAISPSFDPNSPEALSVRDSISNQVYKCWNVPAGVLNADKLKVYVAVKYNQDGTPSSVELTSESRSKANGDFTYKAAADSALRAVRQCSPLKGMPAESYHIWQDVEIEFDPKNMLY